MKMIEMTGKRFGRLVVLGIHDRQKISGRLCIRWKCRCCCGQETVVIGHNLRSGNTKSCGCMKKGLEPKSQKEALKIGKEEKYVGQTDGGSDRRA